MPIPDPLATCINAHSISQDGYETNYALMVVGKYANKELTSAERGTLRHSELLRTWDSRIFLGRSLNNITISTRSAIRDVTTSDSLVSNCGQQTGPKAIGNLTIKDCADMISAENKHDVRRLNHLMPPIHPQVSV